MPENNPTWRALLPQPWISNRLDRFPAGGVIPSNDRCGARVATGPLPLTYAAREVRLADAAGQPVTVRTHQRIKREVFDISGGWVHDTSGGGHKPLESEAFHKILRRVYVNTAHIMDMPGYTDQTGPDGLYARYPLKYFAKLEPIAHYNSDALLPRIHAVEMYCEWRSWDMQPSRVGPRFWVRGGKLLLGGKEIMDLPTGVWLHCEVAAKVGEDADGKWELALALSVISRADECTLNCTTALVMACPTS